MQGINSREHRILLTAFHKFEYLSKMAKNKIEESEENNTRKAMEELDALYDKFQLLYAELEKCTKAYEYKKKSVRSIINKSMRKLAPELQKENNHVQYVKK
ncbi:hypothetical protein [Flavobacterium hydatis]|jgi:hypothetical protein|uniref:Uncharacterized protein n=1 Tax=Flavobacterium hydatis TaxID=991 RepID=A0ABX4CEA3_FLAHY|nr:hypothetical protein [Flavobacterium hydatis]OXA92025.1 hypothetical protein B0A62_16665 [Flavobacterium hydatis]